MVLQRKNKYLLIFVVILSLLFSVAGASAALFSSSYKTIHAGITPDDVATYEVTIENFDSRERVFSLSLAPSDTSFWSSDPVSVTVSANSVKNFTFSLFPKDNVGLGTYTLPVRIQAGDSDKSIIDLPVSVSLDAYAFSYFPDVALNVVVPATVDPKKDMTLQILTRNRNMLDIETLIIEIESDLFFKSYNQSLGPRKEKTQDVSFGLNPLQSPGKYNLKVRVIHPGVERVISEAEKEFEIIPYSQVSVKSETYPSLFLSKEIITLENKGNAESAKEVLITASWIKRMFMSSDPEGTVVDVDGKANLRWNPTLKPTEVKEIVVTTNYRFLAVIILILILAVIIYFIFRSSIVTIKEASVVGEDEEGFSEIKVRIFIKNRSRASVHNISVVDKIPRITNLIDGDSPGSLKPTRVTKSSKRGTVLYWDMDRLESYEERILMYRIKSNLKIVGNVTMPRVRIKFETSTGKQRSIVSGVPLFIR